MQRPGPGHVGFEIVIAVDGRACAELGSEAGCGDAVVDVRAADDPVRALLSAQLPKSAPDRRWPLAADIECTDQDSVPVQFRRRVTAVPDQGQGDLVTTRGECRGQVVKASVGALQQTTALGVALGEE